MRRKTIHNRKTKKLAGNWLFRWRFALDALMLLTLVGGAALLYTEVVTNRSAFLYFFFVPVSAGAVILGRLRGMLYAGIAGALILAAVLIRGLDWLYKPAETAEEAGSLIVWGCLLLITAYLVGVVSERGGNRSVLQGVGSEAIAAVERERRRMGFDVHDGIAQTVTTAQMQVEILEALTQHAGPEIREEVQHLKETIGMSVHEIREMIGNLRPPPLQPDEFSATLQRLIDDFREHNGIKTEFEVEGDLPSHTDSMRICVYRIVQEALSNVEQHADASRVRVGIQATHAGVFLTVADDGVGFDPEKATDHGSNGHFGVLGMHERAALLRGRVRVDSAPGEGTVVRAHIPGPRR